MDFEFDPAKSAANREKHGIDFAEAQDLWDVWGYEKELPFAIEPRRMRTAPWKDRFWTTIYTLRSEKIRLISVRRARKEEMDDYDAARSGNSVLR